MAFMYGQHHQSLRRQFTLNHCLGIKKSKDESQQEYVKRQFTYLCESMEPDTNLIMVQINLKHWNQKGLHYQEMFNIIKPIAMEKAWKTYPTLQLSTLIRNKIDPNLFIIDDRKHSTLLHLVAKHPSQKSVEILRDMLALYPCTEVLDGNGESALTALGQRIVSCFQYEEFIQDNIYQSFISCIENPLNVTTFSMKFGILLNYGFDVRPFFGQLVKAPFYFSERNLTFLVDLLRNRIHKTLSNRRFIATILRKLLTKMTKHENLDLINLILDFYDFAYTDPVFVDI